MKLKFEKEDGGLTVEATLLLPFVMVVMISFIYLIRGLFIYGEFNTALFSGAGNICYKINEVSSITSENIKNNVVRNLNKDIQKDIEGGEEGLDFSGSYYNSDKEEVYINLKYSINTPMNFSGLLGANLKYNRSQGVLVRVWNGNKDLRSNKNFVYVTKYGKVYHTDILCTYLTVKKMALKRNELGDYRNESGGKYYECNECDEEKSGEIVYITKHGTSYHNTKLCSAINRTILPLDIYEIKDRKKCEKCCK